MTPNPLFERYYVKNAEGKIVGMILPPASKTMLMVQLVTDHAKEHSLPIFYLNLER